MKVEKEYTANKKKMEQFVSTGIKYMETPRKQEIQLSRL